MTAANHRERIGAGEKARAGQRSDGLLPGVDQVGIDLVFGRKRADAEQAVFRLQRDVDAIGNEVGHQGRNADAQIDVEAVAQFFGGTLGHRRAHRAFLAGVGAGHCTEFDTLLVFLALDDAVDVDARHVDVVRIELTHGNQMLDLGHADLAAGGDHRIEVACGFAKQQIAVCVALPRLDDRQVGMDRFLQHVLLVAE